MTNAGTGENDNQAEAPTILVVEDVAEQGELHRTLTPPPAVLPFPKE